MAYTRRSYSGNAPLTNLSGSLTNAATSFAVLSGTGYPDGSGGNFVVCIDRGTASEEKILCSARSGATFTVASSGRGWDGTSATAHTSNATVEHVLDAQDLDEANQAVVATLGTIAAKGDLLVGSAANTLAKLSVGANTTLPTADSTQTTGIRWDTQANVLSTYVDKLVTVTPVAGAATIDFSLGRAFSLALAANTTITFSNVPATANVRVSITLALTANAHTVTWPAAVDWGVAGVPAWSASGVDFVGFVTDNAGTEVRGFVGGQAYTS